MADYENDLIKPVKSLDGIAGLAAAKQREERKRRQQLHQEQQESARDHESSPQEQGRDQNNGDGMRIDYCA